MLTNTVMIIIIIVIIKLLKLRHFSVLAARFSFLKYYEVQAVFSFHGSDMHRFQ